MCRIVVDGVRSEGGEEMSKTEIHVGEEKMYIRFSTQPVYTSVFIGASTYVDYDKEGKIVGIDILKA